MQLVEHEESQSLRRAYQRRIERTGQDQLEHHKVREQNVRRVMPDLLPIRLRLLTGVSREGHRRVALGIAVRQELGQLTALAVRQGVHRIDDDCLYATPGPRA